MKGNPHVHEVLILLAFICCLMAAAGIPTNRISMGWLGLTFWFLDMLLPLI